MGQAGEPRGFPHLDRGAPAPRPLAELGVAGRDRGSRRRGRPDRRRRGQAHRLRLRSLPRQRPRLRCSSSAPTTPDSAATTGHSPNSRASETVAPVIGVQALPFGRAAKLVEAQVYVPADGRYGRAIERPRILSGRLPRPTQVHEVALDLQGGAQLHAHVGSEIMLAATLSSAPPGPQPAGLRIFRQRVVGVFMTRDNPVPINALAQLPIVYTTPAFYAGLGAPYRASTGPMCGFARARRHSNSAGRQRRWRRGITATGGDVSSSPTCVTRPPRSNAPSGLRP